jgi:hypothetical protein
MDDMLHIIEEAKLERCALYNELSHMTPYYLSCDHPEKLNINAEVLFHIKNIKLLSLYFDKIFIPLENILAFANKRSQMVIEKVVSNKQFHEFVEMGIITFCGWGAKDKSIMLDKAFSYALKEYKNLKNEKYFRIVEKIIFMLESIQNMILDMILF